MKFLEDFGLYITMIGKLFVRPEKFRMYMKEALRQMADIGVGSLPIIAVIATFVGAVTTVQFGYQLQDMGFIPMWWLGIIVRDSMVLELAPTVSALLLAGKVGSNISSELGTMRISEQIDALEIMGVHATAYLVGPKIIGAIFMIPVLIVIAFFLGVGGGLLAGDLAGFVTPSEYIRGCQDGFVPYNMFVMLTKAVVFAFIIASVSCFQGYYVKGGALDIGKASTRAVVYSSIILIIANFLIAFLLL